MPRHAGGLRPRRLAEDVGLARHPRQRADRAVVERSTRCGAPRWRLRARSSGARRRSRRASGGRRSATACSSTTTRTPRTAPWPRRIRCGRSRTRRVSAPLDVGRDRRLRSRRLHAGDDAGAVRSDRRSARGHRRARRARSRRCSSCRPRHEREGMGDAPWPPHYQKQPGEPPRVQPSQPASAEVSVDRDRAGRRRRKTRSRASSAGRRGIPRRRHIWSRPTCWSTRCAGGFTPGPASA